MIRFLLRITRLIILILMLATASQAGVPQVISYQGHLTDSLGNALSGLYSLTFSIYHDEVGGPLIWSEVQLVTVSSGSFSVLLGSVVEIQETVFNDSTTYLGVQIDASPELPRSQLTTSPYAYRVATVDGSVSTALLLVGPDGTRVELGAGTDLLKVYDSDGDLRIKMGLDSIWTGSNPGALGPDATDGGGAISFMRKSIFSRSGDANAPEEELSLVKLGVSPSGAGEVSTYDINGVELARITSSGTAGGAIVTYLASVPGQFLTLQSQTEADAGFIGTFGATGSQNISLSNLVGNPDNGYLSVKDSSDGNRVGFYADSYDDGSIFTTNHLGDVMLHLTNTGANAGYASFKGSNGTHNVKISHLPGMANQGIIEVYDSLGVAQAGIKVDSAGNGIIWGDQKSFATPNPAQPGTEIWYTSLEGPEAAAYIRGTATLVNGQATINFPEHFVSIASPAGITAVVTPSSAESMGLAVIEKQIDHIVVKELYSGSGNYNFDYTITAVRKGFENYQVIHPITDRITSPKEVQRLTDKQSQPKRKNKQQSQ